MVRLNRLKPALGATKAGKRVGRGQGSGRGGTATRGHKGAQSRSGYKRKRAFEGGQLPLQKRIPRYGFKNPRRVAYKPISLQLIQRLVDKESLKLIDSAVLTKHGLISAGVYYKILGSGTLVSKVDLHAHAFSNTARTAIVKLGGRATLIERYG